MIEIKSTHAATTIEQVTSLVLACAWPIVAIAFMLVFRKQIAGVLRGLEEWSAFGTTLKIRRDIDSAERKIEQAEAVIPVTVTAVGTAKGSSTATAYSATVQPGNSTSQHVSTSPSITGSTTQSPAISPQERILRSWRNAEERVQAIAKARGFEAQDYPDLWRAAKSMNLGGIFTPQILGLLAQLKKLRDEAADGGAASAEDAHRYNLLVLRFFGLVASI